MRFTLKCQCICFATFFSSKILRFCSVCFHLSIFLPFIWYNFIPFEVIMFVVRYKTKCQTNDTNFYFSFFFLYDLNKYLHFLCGQLSNYVLSIQSSSTFVLPLDVIVFYKPNTFTVLQWKLTESKEKMCFSFFYSNFWNQIDIHTHTTHRHCDTLDMRSCCWSLDWLKYLLW